MSLWSRITNVFRGEWLSRFYEIGKEAVRPRKAGELFGFVILPSGIYSQNSTTLVDLLMRANVEADWPRGQKTFTVNGTTYPAYSWIVRMDQPYGGFAKALLESQNYPNLRDREGHPVPPYDVTAHTLPLLMNVDVKPVTAPFKYPRAKGETRDTSGVGIAPMPIGAIRVYRSSVPAMDEGWTRWAVNDIVKTSGYEATISLDDKEIRAGNLPATSRVIVIPDQSPAAILNGYKAGMMPPEYTGGLGPAGVKALREFVEQGGTLVCLNRASSFAIDQFHLPVHDVVKGVSEKEFFVPGSILRIELDTSSSLAKGMPQESIAWVEDSPVFEVVPEGNPLPAANVHVIARYPSDRNPLLSGWLLGEKRIRGKAALVEVILGKGRIILFGFRPQYRGQSLATYPLFFNAISGR